MVVVLSPSGRELPRRRRVLELLDRQQLAMYAAVTLLVGSAGLEL